MDESYVENPSGQETNNVNENDIGQSSGLIKRKASVFEADLPHESNKKLLNPSKIQFISQKDILSLEDIDSELQKTDEELKKIDLNEITFKKTYEVMAILSEKCGVTSQDKCSKDISQIKEQQKESQTKLQTLISESSQTLKKYQELLEKSEKTYKDTQNDFQKIANEIEALKNNQSKDRVCIETALKIYNYLGFNIRPLENQWVIEYKNARVVLEVKNGDAYKVVESNIALAYKDISYRGTELFTQIFKRIVLSQNDFVKGNNEKVLENE